MGQADVFSAKYQAKKLKASGLQKLKFYCQICEKQCRDANGFKNHINSLSHQNRITNLQDKGSSVIEDYSRRFLEDFLRLLRINHGTKSINANKFYQEYILNDRNHIHMNATKWPSLSLFVRYLGQNGYVKVEANDDNEAGLSLIIRLIENSSEDQIKKQRVSQRQKDRKVDEEVSKKMLNEQMEKSKEYAQARISQREESHKPQQPVDQPVKISLKRDQSFLKSQKSHSGSVFHTSDGEDEDEE